MPRPGGVLLLLVFAAIVCIVLWKVPVLQIPPEIADPMARAELENEFRKTLAQVVLGVVVLVGLYFTRRQMIATERRVTAAEQTVEVGREGQITERFTRAVEQLGSDKMEVRLGGIYALERIAKDSAKDRWQVMEVLTAFVRENKWCKMLTPKACQEPDCVVPTDIQAILNVLRRRNAKCEGTDQVLDLSNSVLLRANLRYVNLKRTNLLGANLREASLLGADLRRTNLRHIELDRANLSNADLRNAYLGEIHPHRSRRLNGSFSEAVLKDADLRDANLQGVSFRGADMQGANLASADLQGSNLANANLQYANLANTDLREGEFNDSNFSNSKLQGADLRGAINLTREQIASAVIDGNTKLPDYLEGDYSQ